jgi:hypothetical protein
MAALRTIGRPAALDFHFYVAHPPPSENRVKTFCLAYRWAEKALPISCLFCAPTAGISRQSKAIQSSSQALSRKQVRLKSANVGKTGQIEVKGMNFGC